MIRFAEVPVGSGGGLTCTRCAIAPPERVLADAAGVEARLRHAAESWSAGPGPNVLFAGYEPFAHPELPRLIAAARSLGYRRVCLRTDGGALAVGGNARGAIAAGATQFEVDVLGGSAESHDRLAGRSGLFAAMSAGLADLHEQARALGRSVHVGVRVPVCRHTVAETPAIASWAASVGAGSLQFVAPADGVRPRDVPVLLAALDTATLNGVAAWLSGAEEAPVSAVYREGPYSVEVESR